jgi:drug/metabolite transporter (DMT)-like permease
MNFVFGTIYTCITCLLFSDITLPTIQGFISISWVGIFEMGLTFIVWIQALKLTESTSKVTNLIFVVPFLSLLVIHWVLKEIITWSSITGLILIVFGIAYQQIADYRNKNIACGTDDILSK